MKHTDPEEVEKTISKQLGKISHPRRNLTHDEAYDIAQYHYHGRNIE